MKALIILAHGSARKESNQEIENLTNHIRTLIKNEFEIVNYAFLEISKPSLINSIESIVSKNVYEITIFPYFLNSGIHIKSDIPNIVKSARTKYPDCKFNLSPPIGANKEMPELILKHLQSE
ncbi:MAG: CbiX/SirB N-terminal domain-containing protein [Pseudomonadota bacterium]|nr:CbiX/SirB N-terminal domain-containing protein [Pseudomonadota bacterium]